MQSANGNVAIYLPQYRVQIGDPKIIMEAIFSLSLGKSSVRWFFSIIPLVTNIIHMATSGD